MLLWTVYFLFVAILTWSYGWVIHYISQSWTSSESAKERLHNTILSTPVTVIVIVRNECKNILACLTSILSNPAKLLHQVIVVDDHSDDDTTSQIESLADPKIELLQLSDFQSLSQYGSSYKKSGLHYALSRCQTNWVMTTDGDCIVGDSWINAMLKHAEVNNSDMMTGPIVLHGDNSIVQRWQSIEMMGTMAGTMAGIQSKTYYSANAANMLFRKADYLEYLDAEKHNYASGDDVFFVQWMAKKKKKIGFSKDSDAIVSTGAESTLRGLYQQRLRWSTKTMAYKDIGMKALMALIFIFHMLIFINLVFGCVLMNARLFSASILMLLIKAIFDFRLLNRLSRFFDHPYRLNQGFFIMIFLHSLYIVMIGIIGLFVKNYRWKGRRVR